MQPSGRTGERAGAPGAASGAAVLLHTTAPGSTREGRSAYAGTPAPSCLPPPTAMPPGYDAPVRCSWGLTPYSRLKALDRANALP